MTRRSRTPFGVTRAEQTLDLMRQLNLHGEVDWPASQPVGHIDFNVARPNGGAQVRVDLNAKQAYVKEFKNGHASRVSDLAHVQRLSIQSTRKQARLDHDRRVGVRDGRARGRTHRDGLRQLLHVVAAEKVEGARRGRACRRIRDVRRIRGRSALARSLCRESCVPHSVFFFWLRPSRQQHRTRLRHSW